MTSAPSIEEVLREAQDLGFLGPGPVDEHIHHSGVLAELAGPLEGDWLDLGSGGGVPGLVWLASAATGPAVLVDANARRAAFLTAAVTRLAVGDRAEVVHGRAEVLARRPELRARFAVVVARSFGPPAVTAECAAGFLTPNGRLIVTEPPAAEPGPGAPTGPPPVRWSPAGLATLGFGDAEILRRGDVGAAVLQRVAPVTETWPRRDGVPAKRPLW